ncbi:MAG: LysM peptidoglycan-binding domain-containing protein, partial [Actinomycetota bacterium]|nr:LysM peptidoglycan-binding domain-containing protein [Actinomycetota bacterium]
MARSVRSVGAFLVLLALLVGVPLMLASIIGNPLDGWSDLKAGDLSDTAVIDILAAIAWIAWAQFALATVIEAVALLARVRVPRRIPGIFAGQQHLARALIAAIFVLTPTVIGIVAPATSFASAPARAPAVAAVAQTHAQAHVQAETPQARPQAEVSTPHAEQIAAPTHEYLVPASGGPSTYWELAERYLGAGDQWKQIWQLNEGRAQADGATMLSPGLLRPGWVVLIPGEAPAHTHTVIEHVTVRPGDTLSGIAEKAGQPDWQQAWQVNADRAEPGGREFNDP